MKIYLQKKFLVFDFPVRETWKEWLLYLFHTLMSRFQYNTSVGTLPGLVGWQIWWLESFAVPFLHNRLHGQDEAMGGQQHSNNSPPAILSLGTGLPVTQSHKVKIFLMTFHFIEGASWLFFFFSEPISPFSGLFNATVHVSICISWFWRKYILE